MGKRVCVFVDGENFRHSICGLFPDRFTKSEYLPRCADWSNFFDWIVLRAAGNDSERVRTYWYVVQSIDFSPFGLRGLQAKNRAKLIEILRWHEPFRMEMDNALSGDRDAAIDRQYQELIFSEAKMKQRFESWHATHSIIGSKFRAVEFRPAGSIVYDLFERRLRREKAVDVKLATDLITLGGIYDLAVILSGDQDYVPAVKVVKDSGKHVVNASFLRPDGRLLPGGARRLNDVTDWSVALPYDDVARYLNLPPAPQSSLPLRTPSP